QQHHTVQGKTADQLLCLHGKKIAIQHGCGLDHDFAKAHGRQLQWISAGLQYTTLDRLRTITKMRMTRRQITPGIQDAYNRTPHEFISREPLLLHALTVRKTANIIACKPALAAQLM